MAEEKKDLTLILPHFLLMEKYLEVAKKEDKLLNFYYESLKSFDKITSNSEQAFGKFINDNGRSLSGRYIYIIIQTKNVLDSFFGHYFILKNGLCNTSVFNLRYCYETLLKNYFYLTLPSGEKVLVKYHDIFPSKIRDRLYTPKSLEESHRKLYGGLSRKSHAGIVSSSPPYECSPETYKDSLEFGIYLLHGHFVFLLECFNQFISTKDRDQIKKFFGEFDSIFGVIPTFIPDKAEISSLLKFEDIQLVTPINVEKFKRDEEEYLENS